MADSVKMKLVFRLGGIGFSLPVQDLVEVREDPGGVLDLSASEPSFLVLGRLMHRGEDIPGGRIRIPAAAASLDPEGMSTLYAFGSLAR